MFGHLFCDWSHSFHPRYHFIPVLIRSLVPTTALAPRFFKWPEGGGVVLPMENHPSSQINLWLIMGRSWEMPDFTQNIVHLDELIWDNRRFPGCHVWEIYPTTEVVYFRHHTSFNIGHKYTLNKVVPQKRLIFDNGFVWALGSKSIVFVFLYLINGHRGGLSHHQTNQNVISSCL